MTDTIEGGASYKMQCVPKQRQPEPGRPGSYATQAGLGNPAQNSTTSPVAPGRRRTTSSPDSRSIVAAITFAA